MRFVGRNSLAYRMEFTVLLASSMALGTLTASLLVSDNISSRALLQNRLSTLADVVGQNSTAALNFNDPPAAVEVLEALRAEPPVISACMYELSGELFAQYRRDKTASECPRILAHYPLANPDRPRVLRPVMRRSELVGTLALPA